MKRLIFASILTLSTLSGICQTPSTTTPSVSEPASSNGPSAGSLFVFGSVGVFSQKPAGNNSRSSGYFTFAPGAGYFITDRIALGARLVYGQQFGNEVKGGSTFGLQAFGRYYFLQDMFASKGGFFLEGNIGFSGVKPAYYDRNNSSSSYYYYNTPGFTGQTFGINGNYNNYNFYNGNDEPRTISTLLIGVGPGFALFPTKKNRF